MGWDYVNWRETGRRGVFLPRRPTKSEKPVSGENRSGPIVCAGVNFPHFFNGAPLVDSRRSVGGFRITAVLLCFLVCLSAVSFRSKTARQMHARQNLSGGWGAFFHCILCFKNTPCTRYGAWAWSLVHAQNSPHANGFVNGGCSFAAKLVPISESVDRTKLAYSLCFFMETHPGVDPTPCRLRRGQVSYQAKPRSLSNPFCPARGRHVRRRRRLRVAPFIHFVSVSVWTRAGALLSFHAHPVPLHALFFVIL